MKNSGRKDKKEMAEGILAQVGKVIPGLGSFFEKAEKSKTFGAGMKKIREEIHRRFGKK